MTDSLLRLLRQGQSAEFPAKFSKGCQKAFNSQVFPFVCDGATMWGFINNERRRGDAIFFGNLYS